MQEAHSNKHPNDFEDEIDIAVRISNVTNSDLSRRGNFGMDRAVVLDIIQADVNAYLRGALYP